MRAPSTVTKRLSGIWPVTSKNHRGAGGGAPCVLNAANEIAVAAFLERRIGFLEIAETVERALELLPDRAIGTLDDVYALDREARVAAAGFVASRAAPNAPRTAAAG